MRDFNQLFYIQTLNKDSKCKTNQLKMQKKFIRKYANFLWFNFYKSWKKLLKLLLLKQNQQRLILSLIISLSHQLKIKVRFLKKYSPTKIPSYLQVTQLSSTRKIYSRWIKAYLGSEKYKNIRSHQGIVLIYKRLPYTAMEALSSECHLITNLLFDGIAQKIDESANQQCQIKKQPLIKKLFQFLDYRQHYLLAGYFNKVILSITKRVFSSNHKFNGLFCQLIFGQNKQKVEDSILFKAINHLYSASTIQYILKWLSLSTKTKVESIQKSEEFITEMPSSIIDFKRTIKEKFLLTLVQKLNKKQYGNQILANIPILFEQLFTQESNNSTIKIPQNMMVPFNMKKQQKKLSLYQLSTSVRILKSILQPLQKQKLSLAKINILKILIVKYKAQYKNLSESNDNSQQKDKMEYNLFERIDSEDLQQLIIWIFVSIRSLLQKQSLDKTYKMFLIHFIQLLFEIHTIQILEETIWSYYNDNKDQLVDIIVKIMLTNNNLIQIAQSKLIKFVLGVNRSQNSKKHFVPFDFATKLLIDGIISIVDSPGIRQHVISWAEIILDFQKQHIFQNYKEESEWDHIVEIIQYQKQITIGNSQFFPSNLDIFYSKEKANLVYTNFIFNFKVVVQYEDKEAKQGKLNKKRTLNECEVKKQQQNINNNQQDLNSQQVQQNVKIQKTQQITQMNIQQKVQQDPLSFQGLRMHYLNFDVNHLLQQL